MIQLKTFPAIRSLLWFAISSHVSFHGFTVTIKSDDTIFPITTLDLTVNAKFHE